jgi:small subunit ribosomal protein S8
MKTSDEERTPTTTPTTTTPATPTPATAAPAPEAPERSERPQGKRMSQTRKPRRANGGVPSDPVADMLTRVRNAAGARHDSVSVPASRTKVQIARILKAEGFIGGFEQPSARELVLKMKYIGGKVPAVSGLRRISKPGLRVYARKTEMPRVLGGLGIAIVSTSSGLMTGREAERKGLGGEVLAYVW